MKLLVIEDDKYISGFISLSLRKEGYEVIVGESAAEGMFLFTSHRPDLVILDLGLPDRDGIGVIDDIRAFSLAPIVVVSARGQESDKISALDHGADDYVTKPFHMGELLARLRAAGRRVSGAGGDEPVFSIGDLSVDYTRRRVTLSGEEVHLTPTEYKLLTVLIAERGKVLTHNFLLARVWGYELTGDTHTVRVTMANLRRKIERNTAEPRYILTEIGVGYRFADE